MVKRLVASEAFKCDDSVILIYLRVNASWYSNSQLGDLCWLLISDIFFDHLDVHCYWVLGHSKMKLCVVPLWACACAIEAPEADVHSVGSLG